MDTPKQSVCVVSGGQLCFFSNITKPFAPGTEFCEFATAPGVASARFILRDLAPFANAVEVTTDSSFDRFTITGGGNMFLISSEEGLVEGSDVTTLALHVTG